MESPLIQILVLAGIAVFLILRLKNVLGTREGFEKPTQPQQAPAEKRRPDFEVIEGGPDLDITDYVAEGSPQADALAAMKRAEPSFQVQDFVHGARGAYEMILMGFENGELDDLEPLLAADVYESFVDAVAHREDQGLTIEAEFIGVRETTLADARFDESTRTAEITMRFVAELTSVVRNSEGEIVEGDPKAVKRQKDTWVFARSMGTDDPNWQLVATDA
ncbi:MULTISPECIES: Tim44/TimA family putative adaptor protein [Phaeobacter]|uniref:Tim44/TimA family putative adaptor protein n=1 Tax=Phaeobacter gallaeciensis TaxID=60890 RepID=A0ABD4XB72_9RHOB|nr:MULTISPECIES: Tim44/TimA family putative adaptor protein [Phaeobacter]MDF1772914.1 Tim44/TimA family putative adaptor protein [Pseudophaeobacter sp. bin_em_oilr2.035]MEE2633303.1 Tim44/TimA family putative adaptor protein [Pseudomonadota bacterium]MDE4061136.1 Tim44/TimA family putative adaptor protein [Phaeobacter gallaeciensis]MDE4124071.1 Tim44/TimA family putative adaptor protein [Phaeobacter gallaeciensis]MDE4128541.1 Tim44/TimA family putative adaptor protein [Phaeobacter gallaeciensi